MHVSPRTWTGPELSALWLRTRWLAPEAWHFQDMRACALSSCRPGQHTAPGRRPMRREIFRLERVEDRTGRPFRLPFLCRHCAHALFPEASAMEPGKVYCTQGLELPQCGGFCHGFTRGGKAYSNERPQKALPSSADCCTMEAPENLVRRHKSLSDFPRAGRMLAHILHTSTPASILARCSVILGQIATSGNPRGPAASLGPGSVASALFLFPILVRFSHV